MFRPSKNVQWWWSNGYKTIEKQSDSSGLKKWISLHIFLQIWACIWPTSFMWKITNDYLLPKKAQYIFPKKCPSYKWCKIWRKQKKPCKRVSIFFLVQQNKCIKIKQMGWLEGFWDGTICWNLSICMLIFQHKAADFSSYFFPNTIN